MQGHAHTTVPAFDAIRGHKSAWEMPIVAGQDLRHMVRWVFCTYAFLRDRSSDGRALHFSFRIDYNTSVVLKYDVDQTSVKRYDTVTHLEI